MPNQLKQPANQLVVSTDSAVMARLRSRNLARARSANGLLPIANSAAFTCIAIDNSGSMSGHEDSVVSGLNTILASLKAQAGQTIMELLKFNDKIRSFLPQAGRPASSIYPMKLEQYQPEGGTALHDAIGRSIETADRTKAGQTAIIVITDGQENASREYTLYQTCSLISARIRDGWQFIFIAIGHGADGAFDQYQIPTDRVYNLLDITPSTFSELFTQLAENLIEYNLGKTEILALPAGGQ